VRQLDERAGLRGGQQGGGHREQRIGGASEGRVEILAEVGERGSIHAGPSFGISTQKDTRRAG